MCLALPARVIQIDGGSAVVSLGGVKKQISLALVEGVTLGDYVIVHTGFALSRLDPVEAERTLALFREADREADRDADRDADGRAPEVA